MSNESTPPASADLNSILNEYQPTGASNATAGPDGLPQRGFTGVAASRKMAEEDKERVFKHKDKFVTAGRQFNVPPALLAAIASRESRGGNALDRDGWGDNRNGYGLMQVDRNSHVVRQADGPFGLAHITQATGILRDSINHVARRHAGWPPARQMQGGVAGYNQGAGNVKTLDRMDIGSTHDDYSNDVWARALFYAAEMGSVVLAPAPPSTGSSRAVSFPAPTLAAVLAGTSVLSRRQKGDAVLTLQNALIKLGYLPLTDEVKSGLGNFGPKTHDALVEFQHDVYLTGDGKCDAQTFLAISQLLSASVKRDNRNQVGIVCRLHDRIVALKLLSPAEIGGGYGHFGKLTEGAVQRFQQSQGQPAHGALTLATYLAMRAQARHAPPAVSPPTDGDAKRVEVLLPRGGAGFIVKSGSPAVHQYGTQRTIHRLLAIANEWITQNGEQPIRVGEISKLGGGIYPPHVGSGHSYGIAVDIGLFRKDKRNDPTNYHDPSYDQKLTQKLVTILDKSPYVSKIIFNDPQVKGSKKLIRDRQGRRPVHHNHLHIEF